MNYLEMGAGRMESRKNERAATRSRWGQTKAVVLPFLKEGKTLPEIANDTGLGYWQIANVRKRGRARGELPHPTSEETRKLRSKLLSGRPSHNRGRIQPVETLLKLRKSRLGRELTPVEEEQTRLLVIARQIPRDRGVPDLTTFCRTHQLKPPGEGRNKAFFELFYAARICMRETGGAIRFQNSKRPFLEMADVDHIYEQIDPNIFTRLKKKITFIREETKAPESSRRENNLNDGSKITDAEDFYKSNGIDWPET